MTKTVAAEFNTFFCHLTCIPSTWDKSRFDEHLNPHRLFGQSIINNNNYVMIDDEPAGSVSTNKFVNEINT